MSNCERYSVADSLVDDVSWTKGWFSAARQNRDLCA